MTKTIFITGAAGAIGSATSRRFAKAGYRVGVGYLNQSEQAKAEEVVASLEGTGHIAVECNIDSTESVQKARDTLQSEFGKLTVLFNNAGWTKFVEPSDLKGIDDDLIDGLLRTHVKGYFICVREMEDILEDGGCIINTSSIAAELGNGSNIVYCAAKGAVDTMTRSLARALAPKLRVNAVAPGMIDTGIIKDINTTWQSKQLNETPMQRLATIDELAETVYGCVEHMPFTTGRTIHVDGGRPFDALPR